MELFFAAKFKKIFFGCAVIFLLAGAFSAQATEKIDSYDVDIVVNGNGTVVVTETILYDFGTEERHGIFRNIPYKYDGQWGKFKLRFSGFSVTDENGNPYRFRKSSTGGDVVLKIGDTKTFVSGKNTYVISYSVRRAINHFENFDELYWNAIGTEWTVDIGDPSVTVSGPVGNELWENKQFGCFMGQRGSDEPCEIASSQDGKTTFFSSRNLDPGEGMTVAMAFSKGLIREPSLAERLGDFVRDNGFLALPAIAIFWMFGLWNKRGRDPKGRGSIIAQFDPPDKLTPTEIGIIIDERSDTEDISAAIVHLAVRGYLTIEKMENKLLVFSWEDYRLEKMKDGSNLKGFERKIMEALFSDSSTIKLSSLKNKFHKYLKDINDQAYEEVVSGGYFPENPNKVRIKYVAIGAVFVGAGFSAAIFFEQAMGFIGIASFVATGAVISVFSFLMPARTEKGVLAKEHILGLKKYLSVAEKDRLDFHNAPEKNPRRFEELLPYAMVLGVEKKWAKQFEGIYAQQPDWYKGGSAGSYFSAVALTESLGGFADAAKSATSSGSGGSGGGGFSGGGGGGGGGGSW